MLMTSSSEIPGLLFLVRSPRPLLKKYACPVNWEDVVAEDPFLNKKKAPRPAPIMAIISNAISAMSRELFLRRGVEGVFAIGEGEVAGCILFSKGGFVSDVEVGKAALAVERIVGKLSPIGLSG